MLPVWESIEKPELYLPEDAASAAEVDGASGRNSSGGRSLFKQTNNRRISTSAKINKYMDCPSCPLHNSQQLSAFSN